jgi:bleomycin hydrolase
MQIISRCSIIALVGLCLGCQKPEDQAKTLDAFLDRTPRPMRIEEFEPLFHFDSRNQDTTLVCWSFSTTSFLETEMQRLGLEPVRLSKMYPVYCVFQEKAKRFVQTKGASRFAPGDLFSGVLETIKLYGIVPEEAYRGQARSAPSYNQDRMYHELDSLMRWVRAKKVWNEKQVLNRLVRILDRHLGAPPKEFSYHGVTYSPKTFLSDVVRLPWDDYVLVTSFTYAPFDQFTELRVPDNWAHRTNFFNVPLQVFTAGIREALDNGYSLAIDADISEPSYRQTKAYAIIPPYDIPMGAIDQQAREFRFENGSTTDDHLMHIIGYRQFNGQDWYLVKDSWRTAFETKPEGYFFFHESYVQLKVLAYLVHRDGIPLIARRMPAPTSE